MIFPHIVNYIEAAIKSFDTIPEERKTTLLKMSAFISDKLKANEKVELIYICTHNSRRSHFGQIWGKVASYYYGYKDVETYSGGTESTAFNTNAIQAVKRVGFELTDNGASTNPHYTLYFNDENTEIECFSKVYNDSANPQEGFIAVMTCNSADQNCPFVEGAALRIATPYEDPKNFDGTPQQEEKYNERCKQIATETLFVFAQVKILP
jgi:arsenate reductase (thioredoxin)